ncbi:MAG TPA: fibronectin type III domain-containing protein [Planctomycetota bacterium]|nr:fibronectin type III domain-containing protein [Planctomycetota bacterium]
MRWAAATVFLLAPPSPVTSIGGDRNPDGSITVFWTLPSDPSVAGIWIERERLDGPDDLVIFDISAPVTSFTDASTRPDRSYRYWVFTSNSQGELSLTAAYLEVIALEDLDDDFEFWECHVSSSARPPGPWGAVGAVTLAVLAWAGARRAVKR